MDDEVLMELLAGYSDEHLSWHALLRELVFCDGYAAGDLTCAMQSLTAMMDMFSTVDFVSRLAEMAMLDVVADCDGHIWSQSWSVMVDRTCSLLSPGTEAISSVRFAIMSAISGILPAIKSATSVAEARDMISVAVTKLANDPAFDGVAPSGSVARILEATLGVHVAGLELSAEMRRVHMWASGPSGI